LTTCLSRKLEKLQNSPLSAFLKPATANETSSKGVNSCSKSLAKTSYW